MFRSRVEAGGYLAAMIDGEGTISLWRSQRRVQIGNTDASIIVATEEACRVLGIEFNTSTYGSASRPDHWRPIRMLRISGQRNLRLVREWAAPRSEAKLARLDAMLASYKYKPSVRRRERSEDIPVGELRRLYFDEGLTQLEIAQHFGADQRTISGWMRRGDIPARRPGPRRVAA